LENFLQVLKLLKIFGGGRRDILQQFNTGQCGDENKAEHIVPFWASERTRQNKIYEMRAEKHSINY
jgi:hypothetical protein